MTDTLPFELPIFFTNENLAILAHAARFDRSSHTFHEKLLLATSLDEAPPTTPLSYEISRIGARNRTLSVPHPKSQHLMASFYRDYEHFILNSCTRASFSLRHVSRIATHYVESRYTGAINSKSRQGPDEDPASFRDQSRWASTYFSYRDYSLIYKFFESDEFLGLETRFPMMMSLDISRCFDSMYTHSIEWSMRGKQFSKDHLPSPRNGKVTFESRFDSTIRHGNENETHGIIVGPEYSRIFAEVILQSIDRHASRDIKEARLNVVVKRYVDDYYIFGNTEDDLKSAESVIRRNLSGVNLHLNEQKCEITRRPFSSRTSSARLRASHVIDTFFEKSRKVAGSFEDHSSSRRVEALRAQVLRDMRSISVELGVPYERFASIALSVLDRKLSEIHSSLKATDNDETTTRLLAQQAWLIACIRISQFFFEIDCRVTTSLKIASIYSTAIDIAEILSCSRAPLENQILDGLRNEALGISTQATDEITRINHICAVDALLTDGRRLSEIDLINYVGAYNSPPSIQKLSPFALIALLYLSRRRKRFNSAKVAARDEIERRVRASGTRLPSSTEATLLLTDFISCPHLDESEKAPLIQYAFQAVTGQICPIGDARGISRTSDWISFTDWHGQSDIRRMLARRELTPPYESA